ncbi:hypothetical protein [Angustibacter sp. Root456]|uniref:hypothetical protein n=1 Tax=Angustibacter sp. Root456 TaxID=1736539 RepID=UPI0006F6505D|nr:hypothetical protein [Angustibacter sp. Root456]KQX65929.1 hypothetical protein ASD06_05870 [Angustibacter sp. Root456]
MEECATPARPATAPDADPCWDGAWLRGEPLDDVWAQAALLRTVATLPRLHPWRLGDQKGSSRQLQWLARCPPDTQSPTTRPAFAVLSVTAREPDLDRSDSPASAGLDSPAALLAAMAFGAAVRSVGAVTSAGTTPQWAGAMVRLPGTWLPPVAWLPRELRDLDDPGSAWLTESVDFAGRYSVHADDLTTAAALLTPAVMAIALDVVPPLSAVTVAGDALHVWWPYRSATRRDTARVHRTVEAALRLAEAFPRFVLGDFPDRSGEVEQAMAERRAAAEAYRAARRPGASQDPVLQRIYEQSRRGD